MEDDTSITLSMDAVADKNVILVSMPTVDNSGPDLGSSVVSIINSDSNKCTIGNVVPTPGSSTANSTPLSNANIPLQKKRPSKPQGPEYEYFKIVAERPNGKGYRLRCAFCNAREMNSHAPRMRKHLVYKCTGNVPDEVKDKFRNHKPVYTKNDERIRKSSRKRTAIQFDAGNTSDDEDDDDDDLAELTDHRSHHRSPELFNVLSAQVRKNDETTSAKKPLKDFSEADFDREHKELMTKKMRLEIKVLEDQARFWSKMAPCADKIIKAADLLIESSIRSRTTEHEMPQVHTLYTNPDGSTVLQTAFAETITNGAGDVA